MFTVSGWELRADLSKNLRIGFDGCEILFAARVYGREAVGIVGMDRWAEGLADQAAPLAA